MATVLLADDERLFKAVEGSLLRRDACLSRDQTELALIELLTPLTKEER